MLKSFFFSRKLSKFPSQLIFHRPHFYFSVPNEALKKQLSDLLSTQESLSTSEKPSNVSSLTAFDNKMDVKMFNSQYNYYKLNSVVWIFIGTLTFLFIHPLVSVIPAWVSSGNMLSTFLTNKFAKKLVYKMVLSKENKDLVEIFVALKQRELVANVKNVEMKEIKEMDVEKKKKFIVTFDVLTEKGKMEKGLKFYVDFEHNRIENFKLFEYILTADLEKLKEMQTDEVKEEIKLN